MFKLLLFFLMCLLNVLLDIEQKIILHYITEAI
jgi:hypothetical protein